MDALTAAAQSVEAAQHVHHHHHHHHHHHQLHVRIHAQTLNSHEDQQQQPRQPDAATTGTPVPVVVTPTMRLTSILNAEPESDEADVEFVGIANGALVRESGFVRRNSGAVVDPAVPMQGDARHQANGNMGAVAVGGMGMAMGVGIRWPQDVQRSNLVSDPRTDIDARARQQQQYQPSPSQYELQHQWQQQQQQQQQQQYQQQNQLEQQSQPTTKKKAPAKRERATPPPAQPPATATAASPAAPARAKIAKLSSILASDKFIGNKRSSPIKAGGRTHSTTTLNHGMWSSEEKAAFHEAFGLHGKNWDKVAACILTRTRSQVASFGQKIVRAAAKAADFVPPTASTPSASAATSASASESKSASDKPKQLSLARDASDNNGINPQHLAEDALYQLSQTHQVTLALDSDGSGPVVTTTHVLDLVNGEASQRPRRGARQQETESVVVPQPAASPATQAPAPAVNEVIEINTEESTAETPQKAPQRITLRPPRARVPSVKVRNQQQQVAMPQRKKPKLSVVVSRDASSDDAPPASPSSSSVTSGSGVAARGDSSSEPKRGKKRPPHEFNGITSLINAGSSSSSSSSSSVDGRECEFCRSARGTCAIMNCTSCKRVYHAKCFVNHFKPYCSSDEPIEKQLESLHLNAPSQVKVKIFRCVPCQAAFIENFKKGGYEWDCECPSCSAPQKAAEYRRRLLLQFVYNKVDEKPLSSKRKNPSIAKQASDAATGEKEENNSGAATAKPQEAKKPTRTGTRRTRNTSAPGSENESMEVGSEASVKVPQAALNAAASGKKKPSKKNAPKGFADDTHAEPKTEALESEANDDDGGENGAIETDAASAEIANDQVGSDPITQNEEQEDDQMDCEMDGDAVAEPDQEKEASSRSSPASKPLDAVGDNDDPELSEEDMLAAVAVSFDGGRERFPVVCTETPSLTAGGVWKEGVYYVHRDRAKDSIKCPCCLKHLPRMSREQFVRHADPRFAEIEGKTPWDFLFVLHRDGSVVSPLAPFLKLLEKRKSELGDAALISPNQKRNYQNDFKIPLRSAEPQVEDAEAVKTALNDARKKLESVIIARRAAGHVEPKASNPGSKPMYVIRIVCVSSKLTISMTDGMVQNKLDRSTLGDFPYKDGWLFFDKGTPAGTGPSTSTAVSPLYANVLCECCGREMPLKDFVAHTGLGPWDKKFKHRFVYAPLRDNQRALIEFDRVWQSILTLYKHQALEGFMSTISEVNVRL